MSTLSQEQLKRMEENRKRALEKRASRLSDVKNAAPGHTTSNNVTPTVIPVKRTLPLHEPPTLNKQFVKGNEINNYKGFGFKNSPIGSVNTGTINKVFTVPQKRPNNTVSKKDVSQFYGSKKIMSGCCKLISIDKFEVDIGYQEQLINIFKSIPSRSYDAKERKWSFHLQDYNLLMSKIQDLKGLVSVGCLPNIVIDTFRNGVQKIDCSMNLLRIDPVLLESVMPFQMEGIRFGISKQGRCLIADDMGLGKSIQALGITHYYFSEWPMLIVCPSSVRYVWQEHIFRWLPSIPEYETVIVTNGSDYIGDAKIVILSYDLMSRMKHELQRAERNFRVLIMDESHYLKNFKSERTKVANLLFQKAKRIVLLSGTPALSRPEELFTQIRAIDPKAFRSMQEFGIRYCAGEKTAYGWNYSGSSNMEELQLLLEARIMIRRLKKDVISQLPTKVRKVVILNQDLITAGDKLRVHDEGLKNKKLKGMERRGALLKYYCVTGKAKILAIKHYLEKLLSGGNKFVCFAHHKEVMDAICMYLDENSFDFIRIDGPTAAKDRKLLCDKFQFEKNCRVAVLSITAANAGITLCAANLVVFAELFWNPGILTQAEDRVHRIGQQKEVTVEYLVAKRTADDYLWGLIQSKLDVLNKAGLSKDNFYDSDATELQNPYQKTMIDYFQELNENEKVIPEETEQYDQENEEDIDCNDV